MTEIPSQEPKPRPPRKRAAPRSTKYTDIFDDRGFLGGSREADKAHIKAGDHIRCNCENHETSGITEIFRAGVTTPKELWHTYKRYADVALKEHQKYIEDGFKHPYQIAEEILIYENNTKK